MSRIVPVLVIVLLLFSAKGIVMASGPGLTRPLVIPQRTYVGRSPSLHGPTALSAPVSKRALWSSTSHGRTSSDRLLVPRGGPIGTRRLYVPGIQGIIPEEPGFTGGRFIAPNEIFGHLYRPILRGLGAHGVTISVGTFRTFDRAAFSESGSRDPSLPVFMLDVDRQATEFNEEIIDAIRVAPKHRQFLDWLKSKHPQLITQLTHQLTEAGDRGQFLDSSILGSPQQYAKVRRQVLSGRFVPVNGSLSGDATLPAIGAALRSKGQVVSVLDISNVLDHLHLAADLMGDITDQSSIFRPQSRSDGVAKMIRNLEALPFSRHSVVLFTTSPDWEGEAPLRFVPRVARDHNVYFAMSAADFLKEARAGALDTPDTKWRFIERLIRGQLRGWVLQ